MGLSFHKWCCIMLHLTFNWYFGPNMQDRVKQWWPFIRPCFKKCLEKMLRGSRAKLKHIDNRGSVGSVSSVEMGREELVLTWVIPGYPGWWLGHPSEKYESVNWDDEIPNIWENKTCSKPPTSICIIGDHELTWTKRIFRDTVLNQLATPKNHPGHQRILQANQRDGDPPWPWKPIITHYHPSLNIYWPSLTIC